MNIRGDPSGAEPEVFPFISSKNVQRQSLLKKKETGAQGIRNVKAFARYDEYRPWHKDDADIIYMISYCYECEIDDELGDTAFESHEVNNGMTPMWVNIHDAIAHNEDVMANSDKKGLSIERETYLLKQIVERLVGVSALVGVN